MKMYLHAFAMCQSMFCSIPAPQIWDEKAKDSMLLFLPVVGLEIGILWALLAWLLKLAHLPALVTGAVLCAYPGVVTGFIHLDGFMDVTDAVMSWRDQARRREILKDSHVGSFSVIGLVLLMLAQFALFSSAPEGGNHWILILIPAVSRCCSALAVTGLKPMPTSQYAGRKKPGTHLAALWVMTGMLTAAGFLLWGKYGCALVGCMAGYGLALRHAYKSLGGMNGDISGFSLTIGELCAVAVYALI